MSDAASASASAAAVSVDVDVADVAATIIRNKFKSLYLLTRSYEPCVLEYLLHKKCIEEWNHPELQEFGAALGPDAFVWMKHKYMLSPPKGCYYYVSQWMYHGYLEIMASNGFHPPSNAPLTPEERKSLELLVQEADARKIKEAKGWLVGLRSMVKPDKIIAIATVCGKLNASNHQNATAAHNWLKSLLLLGLGNSPGRLGAMADARVGRGSGVNIGDMAVYLEVVNASDKLESIMALLSQDDVATLLPFVNHYNALMGDYHARLVLLNALYRREDAMGNKDTSSWLILACCGFPLP